MNLKFRQNDDLITSIDRCMTYNDQRIDVALWQESQSHFGQVVLRSRLPSTLPNWRFVRTDLESVGYDVAVRDLRRTKGQLFLVKSSDGFEKISNIKILNAAG